MRTSPHSAKRTQCEVIASRLAPVPSSLSRASARKGRDGDEGTNAPHGHRSKVSPSRASAHIGGTLELSLTVTSAKCTCTLPPARLHVWGLARTLCTNTCTTHLVTLRDCLRLPLASAPSVQTRDARRRRRQLSPSVIVSLSRPIVPTSPYVQTRVRRDNGTMRQPSRTVTLSLPSCERERASRLHV